MSDRKRTDPTPPPLEGGTYVDDGRVEQPSPAPVIDEEASDA